jgi:hypothetical protein
MFDDVTPDRFLFHFIQTTLESLSIRDVWYKLQGHHAQPVPVEAIMKMVRLMPRLRYLRSSLSRKTLPRSSRSVQTLSLSEVQSGSLSCRRVCY